MPPAPEVNERNFPQLQVKRRPNHEQQQDPSPAATTNYGNFSFSFKVKNPFQFKQFEENINDFQDLINELNKFNKMFNNKSMLNMIRNLNNLLKDKKSDSERCLTLFNFLDNVNNNEQK